MSKTVLQSGRGKVLSIPLLSGGIDSAVSTLIVKQKYGRVQPIFIDWSCERSGRVSHTSHINELRAARRIASLLCIEEPYVIKVPFTWYAEEKRLNDSAFPYARNLVFLALAASYAATEHGGNCNVLVAGFNQSDQGGADTSKAFVDGIENLLRVCIEGNSRLERVRIDTPLIDMTKAEIIAYAYRNGAQTLLESSWSCYGRAKVQCGKCANCIARKEAFATAGFNDPTIYATDS